MTFSGRNMIELRFAFEDSENTKIFNQDPFKSSAVPTFDPQTLTLEQVTNEMINGFTNPQLFPLLKTYAGIIRLYIGLRRNFNSFMISSFSIFASDFYCVIIYIYFDLFLIDPWHFHYNFNFIISCSNIY
jgi:hypothetical protein